MTVNRYATQAGKKYETDLMKHLREQGYDVERLRLTGAEDEGDLLIRFEEGLVHRAVLEAKRRKTMDLGGWIKEAIAERENYVKHRNQSLELAFLVARRLRSGRLNRENPVQWFQAKDL